MSWDWDNLMRDSPGFRFNDNRNFLYDRDIMHKRNEEKDQQIDLSNNWEDFGDFGDFGEFEGFTGLMEDASLYPANLGLFDRTILTRVQKRGDQLEKRENAVFNEDKTKKEDEVD